MARKPSTEIVLVEMPFDTLSVWGTTEDEGPWSVTSYLVLHHTYGSNTSENLSLAKQNRLDKHAFRERETEK